MYGGMAKIQVCIGVNYFPCSELERDARLRSLPVSGPFVGTAFGPLEHLHLVSRGPILAGRGV